MKKITDKQKRILEFLKEEQLKGHFPTYREIKEHFRLSSIATVYEHISALERKGYIEREGKARSIRVKNLRPNKFPLIGAVHAGGSTLATEEIEGFLPLPIDIRSHPNAFLLKVKGDSMINAHIKDGDLVVVDPDKPVEIGDICIALIGEEATVKRLAKIGKKIYLAPENPLYQPIPITKDTKIIGKVIGLWRASF